MVPQHPIEIPVTHRASLDRAAEMILKRRVLAVVATVPLSMTYDKAGPLADFATGPALSALRHRRSRRHPTMARTAR